jgi:hypothetical protein
LDPSFFGGLLYTNGHGNEQEGQPNVSYQIDSSEPSAEMHTLSKVYSYHASYSGEGNDPESLGVSPLRSGSVAQPNAGAAELPSPIPTVNATNHDISTIASPSLGGDSDEPSSSMLMDSSEGREPGDLTDLIPPEQPSWVDQVLQAQQGSPTQVFGSFRAGGIVSEAIFHGSGGGLDDDEEGDVRGREEEVDVEEADAKRRAEEEAAQDMLI